MNKGDRVFYRTAQRKRELLATLREVSPCGAALKVFKRSRTSWVAKADVVKVLPPFNPSVGHAFEFDI